MIVKEKKKKLNPQHWSSSLINMELHYVFCLASQSSGTSTRYSRCDLDTYHFRGLSLTIFTGLDALLCE